MPTEAAAEDRRHGEELAEFILSHKDRILAEWEAAVRALPSARNLSEPVLMDSVPKLLESIASAIGERDATDLTAPKSVVEEHAFHRLESGYDLGQVVIEYSLLRDSILRLWEKTSPPRPERTGYRVLHRAIDDSISLSVDKFTNAQARAQRALDRIATASLESHDLDDLLRRLLLVLIEMIPAIDTATILLRDADLLRVKATVGLEGELEQGFVVKIGDGFAGTIAAEGRPMALRSAASDPLVTSPVIRERGVRALYGVPLVDRGAVMGVAHIGSLTAYEFAEQDRRLLDALAARATMAIYQHMLRREAERRAAELTAVIESIPEAVFIADANRFTTANHRALELLGVGSIDELPGSHAEMLGFIKARHAATGEAVTQEESGFARAFRGETTVYELAVVRADGQERIVRSAIAPIETGGKIERAVGVTTDITEEKRYQHERAELLDSERRARGRAESAELGERFLSEATAILNSSLDYERTLERVIQLAVPVLADWCSVHLVGDDGALRMVNLASADLAQRELVKRISDKYPVSPEASIGEVVRTGRAEMGEVDEAQLAAIAHDEEHLAVLRTLGFISYLAVPISARGRVFGALSLAMTRSSERRYGRQHLEIAEHLGRRAGLAIDNARLYREAQEASRTREQVLAIVSHDLRNPLSVILMSAASTMRRARASQDGWLVKQAETVHRSASRMERLIADLLDMASIHTGRLKVELKPQPIGDVIREAVDLHQPLAIEHGIELGAVLEVAPDTAGLLDRERILQALSNLLGNSLKFCEPGDRITLRVRREPGDDHLVVTVADTGPGISRAEQQHIFEPYWSAARNGKKGTGLGLFITRGIVEAHGARIRVESQPGGGTEFFFTLPLAPQPAGR
jgi:PAS domain S-box-containing protein